MKPEVYVSVDIETDGQVAGISNMLSCGAVAFLEGQEISSYYFKIQQRPEFQGEQSTLDWWATQPKETWLEATEGAEPAEYCLPRFKIWLEGLPGSPIFCGTPAAWDFSFVWYYLNRFAGGSPFKHRALDIRSYAMGKLDTTFMGTDSAKKIWGAFRTYKPTMEHNALEDAREQGIAFMNLMKHVPEIL